jgi:glycerol uptake facilitator-like aquaporin
VNRGRPLRPRRLIAEYLGTLLLVTAVVGSGIMAVDLSPDDVGLQLLENSVATMLALAVLILILGPVSGAHFNPVVTLADWGLHRRDPDRISAPEAAAYIGAQILGAISGAILANLMFGLNSISWSATTRTTPHLWIGETVATSGLILLIFALVRTHRTQYAPAAVGAYIGAAYWFTSSTSFANPAVTIGRAFTDTFAGISPASVPAFITFQIVGAVVGLGLVAVLYPRPQTVTGDTAAIDPTTTEKENTTP